MPFISGISMSSSIRSNASLSTSSSAWRPFLASVILSKPRSFSARIRLRRMVRLSSTTSTEARCNGTADGAKRSSGTSGSAALALSAYRGLGVPSAF